MSETIYDRIKRIRIERGMTQLELAKLSGYAGKDMISRVESGKVDIKRDRIEKIAAALRVSPVYLLVGDRSSASQTIESDEAEHMKKYRMLDAEDRARIDERICMLLESEKYKKDTEEEAM